MDPRSSFDGLGFDMPQFNPQQTQQIYGSYNMDSSQLTPNLSGGTAFGEANDAASVDDNDPKRRRIARVRGDTSTFVRLLIAHAGLRYVPEEKDQMRRQDAEMLTLPKLQNRMCFHSSREEEESSQRVLLCRRSRTMVGKLTREQGKVHRRP